MSDCLIHYGIQGQKWGVRRYQNEDGSLTSEGMKRYLKDSGLKASKSNLKTTRKFLENREILNKKFDKHTEKILKDKAAGKKISKGRINKAIKLGTNVRSTDALLKNPKEYYKRNNRDYKIGIPVAAASTIGLAAVGVHPVVAGLVGVSIGSIQATATNVGLSKYYSKDFEKAKELTMDDLKKHGII